MDLIWLAVVFLIIPRKGLERKPIMDLLKLIYRETGSHETEHPFSGEEVAYDTRL